MDTYSLVMLIVLFAVFYFLMIRPESKRKKQAQQMRDSLKKGDVITTIGGIIGKIVAVNEGTIVIETSEDRVRMEITKWAVSTTGAQTNPDAPANKKKKKDEEPSEEAAPAQETPAVEAPAAESAEEAPAGTEENA